MKTIAVPNELVEALLAYLWSRPLSEAYDLFNRLSALVHEQAEQSSQANKPAQAGGLLHRDQLMNQ